MNTESASNVLRHLLNKYPNEQWDWEQVSCNPNINILENLNELSWDWFSANPSVNPADVLANLDKPWDWNALIRNPSICDGESKVFAGFALDYSSNVGMEFIAANPDMRWNWYWLGVDPNISIADILANLDKPWNYSYNPNITIDMLNMNFPTWNWYMLSQNVNITLVDIVANLNYEWDWHGINSNPNLSTEYILANLDMPWDTRLSSNLNAADTLANLNKLTFAINWFTVSKKSDITDIAANPGVCDWFGLSRNLHITIEFIEANLENMSFEDLSTNEFNC